MIFRHHRLASDANSTRGILYGENVGSLICAVLEDAFHEEKVWGKTRIPEGMYRIGFHQSPKFNARYNSIVSAAGMEFHGMIELLDVPNFSDILLHGGNKPVDTDGCLLCGTSVLKSNDGYYIPGGESMPGFLQAYRVLTASMLAAETWIHVVDFDRKGTVSNG